MAKTKSQKIIRNISLFIVTFTLTTSGTLESGQATCPCNQKMETKLKSSYTYYTDTQSVLEFRFQVNKKDRYVDVRLVGQNFGPWDGDWTGKDPQSFLRYLGAIGQDVSKQMQKPIIKFRVIDLENHELGLFQYGK